jgi:TonB family protein
MVTPVYPADAQARGQRGIVILEIVVGPGRQGVGVQIIRSVPPFDEPATEAVRQWEYEVTKVQGKPVSVKFTVPILFAMKLPDVTERQEGIPELRAGAIPADALRPAGARQGHTAEVTLGTDGAVEELRVLDGAPALAESLTRALRTWRFLRRLRGGNPHLPGRGPLHPRRQAQGRVHARRAPAEREPRATGRGLHGSGHRAHGSSAGRHHRRDHGAFGSHAGGSAGSQHSPTPAPTPAPTPNPGAPAAPAFDSSGAIALGTGGKPTALTLRLRRRRRLPRPKRCRRRTPAAARKAAPPPTEVLNVPPPAEPPENGSRRCGT